MLSYAIAVAPKNPNHFIKIEQTIPHPLDHDLVIEVKAAAMNPVDTKVHASLKGSNILEPRILGWDGAGIVIAMGKQVQGFNLGDEVWYAGDITRAGSNATHQLVDYRIAAHKPKSLDWAQAAAMPLTSLTAWESLFEKLNIDHDSHNKTLLIIGGAGGVGSLAIPLAALRSKINIVATASRPESVKWCLDRGAHLVVDYHNLNQNLAQNGIKQVDYILCLNDTDQHWQAMSEIIAPFGHICSIVESKHSLEQSLIRQKSVSLHWELMFTRSRYQTPDMAEQGRILQQIAMLVDNGQLTGSLTKVLHGLTVENIELAHQMQLEGHMQGKIALEY